MTDRLCHECGITDIPDDYEVDGEPVVWVDVDLCSACQDRLDAALVRDAARYRYLRNRQTRQVDIWTGGLFAGQIPENKILGGENLDRAIDAAMGAEIPAIEPLERRLAICLAECIDTPLISGRDECGWFGSPLDLRLGFFQPELSEKAAELLEEAGL